MKLAEGLTLPAAPIATEVVGSLGNRGGGKSNGAALMVEEMLDAKVQVVVLDYVGIWFSLRLQPDGKTPSRFQIPVLGGPHKDIALSPMSGKLVAEALASSGSSAVLDLSEFSKSNRMRFAADFAEALFMAKKRQPSALHLVLEESQRYIPQKIYKGEGVERMLGAFEEIAEVGRNYGIGMHLISQRPQKIAKDVLNLADTLFVYRTLGVAERRAIDDWVQEKGAKGRDEIGNTLPKLAQGHAIVWCPSRGVFGEFAIRKKSTYDAGATPLQRRNAVRTRPLDLSALEKAMGADVVEEGKKIDPRVLQARINELEAQLAKRVPAPVVKAAKPERPVKMPPEIGKAAHKFEDFRWFFASKMGELRKIGEGIEKRAVAAQEAAQRVHLALQALEGRQRSLAQPSLVQPSAVRSPPARIVSHVSSGADSELSKCARALLNVLAQRGIASDSQISALSGYRKTSSGFQNALSELRTRGFFTGDKHRREITATGRERAGTVEPLPRGLELRGYWKSKLGKCEGMLLDVLVENNGEAISRDFLATRAGYSVTSSGFQNAISALNTLSLIEKDGSLVRAARVFYE